MSTENACQQHKTTSVEMRSFEDVEQMINFFYANKSRFQVMKGEKSYSNPNPPDLSMLKNKT